MSRVPEIRFNGFTDAWEQRELGEVVDFSIKTNSLSRANLSQDSGEIKNIHYGDILVKFNSVLDLKTEKLPFINLEYSTLDKFQFLKDGDLVFADAAEDNSVGKCIEIRGALDDKVTSGLHTIAGTPKVNFASFYLGYYLNSNNYHDKLLPLIQGTKVSSISKNNLSKSIINYPKDFEEQQKIGELFIEIDQTITLHQRKLEHLQQTKTAFLQKMFPKPGETVPDIRFPGFTDAWEYRKLNQISKKVTKKNKDNAITETFTNSAEKGIVSQREFFEKEISNIKNIDGYYVVSPNDFVYNPRISNYAPVGPIKRNNLNRLGVISPLYFVFQPADIDYDYLEVYFETTYWHLFMKVNGDSGARSDRFAIKDSILQQMPIPYPSINEQRMIGGFFKDVNQTIVNCQRELELLKQTKQGFLQKMFPKGE